MEWPATNRIAPITYINLPELARDDARIKAVTETVFPFSVKLVELKDDGVIVARRDPLDVILLGPALDRGAVVRARPIGLLRLLDDGERDDKVLAVQMSGPMSEVTDFRSLDEHYSGALTIIETWFTNYKGPGRLESRGIGGAEEAIASIREASQYFEGPAERLQ